MRPRDLIVLAVAALTPALGAGQDPLAARKKPVDLGGARGFVIEPAEPGPKGARPWVWYAPTVGNYPNGSTDWMFRQLLDSGCYVAGVDVGESMGNPAGRKTFSQFYDHVVSAYGLAPKARLLVQSRGGLMLYNWAVENPDKVECVAGIYPVCDLRSYPGLPRAAKAFGVTPAGLEKVLPDNNPIDRLGPLAKARVPVLHVHGDSDTVVPLKANSQVLYDRYRDLGGPMTLIVVPGKGHAEVPEFFREPRLVTFLKAGGLPADAEKSPRP